jgi:2Fe-2S iron-sulfur cluster binding domain
MTRPHMAARGIWPPRIGDSRGIEAAVRDLKRTAIGGSMVTLNINGHDHSVDTPNDTPLLWVIREHLQMTGTKFGCGAGLCGACTVHLNGEAVRSCQTAVSQAAGKKITTIEGLDPKGEHPDTKLASSGYFLPVGFNMGFVGLASGAQLIEQANGAIEAMLKDGEFATLAPLAHMTYLPPRQPYILDRLMMHDLNK